MNEARPAAGSKEPHEYEAEVREVIDRFTTHPDLPLQTRVDAAVQAIMEINVRMAQQLRGEPQEPIPPDLLQDPGDILQPGRMLTDNESAAALRALKNAAPLAMPK